MWDRLHHLALSFSREPLAPRSGPSKECPQTYSIQVSWERAYVGDKKRELSKEDDRKLQRFTENVMSKRDCHSTRVDEASKADLKIKILYPDAVYNLATQDFFTELSLGVIPTWGMQGNKMRISFESTVSEDQGSYVLDEFKVNHILLTPFIWVNLFIPGPLQLYPQALNDFLE